MALIVHFILERDNEEGIGDRCFRLPRWKTLPHPTQTRPLRSGVRPPYQRPLLPPTTALSTSPTATSPTTSHSFKHAPAAKSSSTLPPSSSPGFQILPNSSPLMLEV